MDPAAASEVLASPDVRAAIAAGDTAAVVRLVRMGLGVRQADLGAAIGRSQSAVSRLEAGNGKATDVTVLVAVAAYLGIPLGVLGLRDHVFTTVQPTHTLTEEEVRVRRAEFIRGALGAAAMLAFPRVLTGQAQRVSDADVTACGEALGRLYELDSSAGSGHIYALNEDLVGRIRRVLDTASYSPGTGRRLREVLAGGLELAGWLSYDAGRHADARRWWLECLHVADVGDHTTVRTVALASMSLQASTLGRGNEAVDLARAAGRDPSASNRVRSLLAAREARGLAARGDKAASARMFATAEQLIEPQASGDPAWISFYGPADLVSHRVASAMLLRDFPEAERAARRVVAARDAGRWTRNKALYEIRLGSILARRGALEESISLLVPAVSSVATIASGRVHANLRSAVRIVAGHSSYRPAREFAGWAQRMMATT